MAPAGLDYGGRHDVSAANAGDGAGSRSATSCARLRAQAAAGGVAAHRTGATKERREEGAEGGSRRRDGACDGATCAAWIIGDVRLVLASGVSLSSDRRFWFILRGDSCTRIIVTSFRQATWRRCLGFRRIAERLRRVVKAQSIKHEFN